MRLISEEYDNHIISLRDCMTITSFPKYSFPVLTIDATYHDTHTEEILDVLEAYGQRATFFLSGIWTEKYSSHIPRMLRLGCELGNHSYDHSNLTEFTPLEIREQIEKTQQINKTVCPEAKKYFRFPYGCFRTAHLALVRHMGYTVCQWSIDSLDWKYKEAQDIYEQLRKVGPGDIVVMHNDGAGTAIAIEKLLLSWEQEERNLRFGTVSEGLMAATVEEKTKSKE